MATATMMARRGAAVSMFARLGGTRLKPSLTTGLDGLQTRRWYRGGAGEMKHRRDVIGEQTEGGAGGAADPVLEREEALLSIAKPRYDAIYEEHVRLPTLDGLSKDSLGLLAGEGNDDDEKFSSESSIKEMELEIRRKRLIYRSKQRGWLEVDLLLGTWAKMNVPSLSSDELDEFERFVNLETIDIYNVLTLRTDIPDEFKVATSAGKDGDSVVVGIVERIQEWAKGSPLGKAEPSRYESVKRENNLI